jgi:rhomboid-like protein
MTIILPRITARLYFTPNLSLSKISQLNSKLFFCKNGPVKIQNLSFGHLRTPGTSISNWSVSSHGVPKILSTTVLKNSFLPSGPLMSRTGASMSKFTRNLATHRDMRGSYGGNGGSQWGRYWKMFQYPIYFSLGVVAFNAIALPVIFHSPFGASLKRRPDLVVYGLIGINLLGFLAWKTRRGSQFMYRYGLLHKDSQFTTWSMLGSAFSHQDFWHVGINMFVLYQFGTPVAKWLGSERFLEAYLDGAVLASLGSMILPVMFGVFSGIPSLGASGAVFTIFGLFSCLNPNAGVGILFIPIYFPALYVFMGASAWNAAGLVLRWGRFDYAGHLAGSAVGAAWAWILKKRAEQARRRRAQGGQW